MHLQKLASNTASNRQSKAKSVAFKSKLTFDVGASDPRGSLKILVQDNQNNDLFEYKGFVNDTTAGFEDNDDFVKKIAQATDVETLIAKDQETIKTRIIQNNLSADEKEKLFEKLNELEINKKILQNRTPQEKKLTGLALLLPGTIQQKTALFMANLKKVDPNAQGGVSSLTNVNLDKVIAEIKAQGKVKLADRFDIKKDFVPCKDLAGTGIGIAKKIANHSIFKDRFDKGFFGVAVQTGGGFGAVNIKLKQDSRVSIETDESGHDLYYDPKTGKEIRLGKLGASTGSVIENYATKMGITATDDIEALKKTGMAQLATDEEIKLNNAKDAAAIEVLKKTGAYDITNAGLANTTLKVKNSHLATFKDATSYSIGAYADTLARHAITKINRGANLYVVSGPLAMGLNRSIKADPQNFGTDVKDMRDLILKSIDSHIKNDYTPNALREANHFDVICDPSLSVDNNTSGGSLLISKNARKKMDVARRGEWMDVPLDVLKTKGNNIFTVIKTNTAKKIATLKTRILRAAV